MPSRDQEIREIYKNMFQLSPSLLSYVTISGEARQVFRERNKLYGDAFRETGVYGTFAVLAGDVARLRKMIYTESGLNEEQKRAIQDKLLDVINQAIITIMMFRENNYTGEESK